MGVRYSIDFFELAVYAKYDADGEVELNAYSEPDSSPRSRALQVLNSLITRYDANAYGIPEKVWFQMLAQLFECCRNVETIDIPVTWWETRLWDTRFPKITANAATGFVQPRAVPGLVGRYRLGKNPEVSKTETESVAGTAGEASHSTPQT